MIDIPQAAIDAAAEDANIARWRARLVLEAAAPYMLREAPAWKLGVADERERIRQALMERQATLAYVSTNRHVIAVLVKDIEAVLEQP